MRGGYGMVVKTVNDVVGLPVVSIIRVVVRQLW